MRSHSHSTHQRNNGYSTRWRIAVEATYLNRFDDPAALGAGLRLCGAEGRPHIVEHLSQLGDRVLQG
jgi:transposase